LLGFASITRPPARRDASELDHAWRLALAFGVEIGAELLLVLSCLGAWAGLTA
jgi:hypothetical protein